MNSYQFLSFLLLYNRKSGEDDIKSVEDGLEFVKQIFPYHLFQNEIPAIIWKHQIYALIDDRTNVDKTLVSIL